MALTPGSTPTITTVTATSTPQSVELAGLSAAELFTIQNLGTSAVFVAWFDLKGIQIGGIGSGASTLTLDAGGAFSSLPFPTVDTVRVWTNAPGGETVNFVVQS